MPAPFEALLARIARGELTVAQAKPQLESLVETSGQPATQLIARVQSGIVAGTLSHAIGRALLEVLESAAHRTVAMSGRAPAPIAPTIVRREGESPRPIDDDATMKGRPKADGDKTVRMTRPADPDATVRKPPAQIEQTAVRPSAPDEESTEFPPRTQPQSTVDSRLRGTDGMAAPQDPDATQRTVKLTTHDSGLRRRDAAAPSQDPEATVRTVRPVSDADETVRTSGQFPPTAAKTLPAPPGGLGNAPYTATLKHETNHTQVLQSRLVQNLADEEAGPEGPLQPGSVVKKRFVLETLLGKGGMGLVFGAIDRRKEEARDPNPRVALKVLNPEFARHPQSFMALQREARKAQTLAHPNVVTVFDFDRDGDVVYMTMEMLPGRPLDSLAREARGTGVKPEIALPIIRGIAEGLAYAHKKGIVHSDLKPGNVFITEDGPKILDFGISRAVPSSVNDANRDVFDAGSLGAYTEAYATDEMIEGIDPHPADDMYALGIIGYELLTGYHPYQRHSAPNARKLGIKPPALKGMKLREARAIERCLSLERKNRPQNAAEFLKLFRGVSTLQKATIAASGVLAVVAGWLFYQNWVETHPAVPFSRLPATQQADFLKDIEVADEAWEFYVKEKNPMSLQDAAQNYGAAYAIHKRNPDAVAGLKRVAAAYIKEAGDDPEMRKTAAEALLASSEYYKTYEPVLNAAR